MMNDRTGRQPKIKFLDLHEKIKHTIRQISQWRGSESNIEKKGVFENIWKGKEGTHCVVNIFYNHEKQVVSVIILIRIK